MVGANPGLTGTTRRTNPVDGPSDCHASYLNPHRRIFDRPFGAKRRLFAASGQRAATYEDSTRCVGRHHGGDGQLSERRGRSIDVDAGRAAGVGPVERHVVAAPENHAAEVLPEDEFHGA